MRVTSTSASGPRASMVIFCDAGAGAVAGGAAAAWTAPSQILATAKAARANAASFIGVRAEVYAKPLPAR